MQSESEMDGNLPPPTAGERRDEGIRHQSRRLPHREGEEASAEEEEQAEAGPGGGAAAAAAGGCRGAGGFRRHDDGDGGDQEQAGRGESGGARTEVEADIRWGVEEILGARADFADDEDGRRRGGAAH